jgi:endonuclease/exonuclease/phosphatase family metal-dependent hydrolase
VDLDGSTSESYREYVTPKDSNTAARPVLKVTYGGNSDPAPVSSGNTLRVLHWNTHHNGVGSDGVLDTPRLIKWVAKTNPDIVSLQEVERYTSWGNMDAPAVMANLLTQYSGKTWYYRFATFTGAAKGIGDLILSRFPIDSDASRLLVGERSATNVTVNVNGRTINVTSVHLHPDSQTYRLQEIAELTAWLKAFPEQRIIAGDFNATYTHPENAAMTQTYYDSWAVAQANGTDVAYAGNESGNTRNGRIDFIYYSHGAAFLTMKGSQVFDTRDANGVTPSDHKPLMTTFTVK